MKTLSGVIRGEQDTWPSSLSISVSQFHLPIPIHGAAHSLSLSNSPSLSLHASPALIGLYSIKRLLNVIWEVFGCVTDTYTPTHPQQRYRTRVSAGEEGGEVGAWGRGRCLVMLGTTGLQQRFLSSRSRRGTAESVSFCLSLSTLSIFPDRWIAEPHQMAAGIVSHVLAASWACVQND